MLIFQGVLGLVDVLQKLLLVSKWCFVLDFLLCVNSGAGFPALD